MTFGINQDPKVWTLSFENRSSTEANNIEDFLEARKGVESFNWSPPDDTDTYRWICREWQKTLPYSNLFTITATFEQVFEANGIPYSRHAWKANNIYGVGDVVRRLGMRTCKQDISRLMHS